MIFGYNTDVKSSGTVFHVQTEDRGEKNPVIDSVIYVKGQIIDRQRTAYDPSETSPEELQARVKQQHRTLVESIRNGTYRRPDADAEAEGATEAAPAAVSPSQPPSSVTAAAAKPRAEDWGSLLAEEPAPPVAPPAPAAPAPAAAVHLELLNGDDVERGEELVFLLSLTDAVSGRAVPGAHLEAVLQTSGAPETRDEAVFSGQGTAEIRFLVPRGSATVLFRASTPSASDLLKFRVLASPE